MVLNDTDNNGLDEDDTATVGTYDERDVVVAWVNGEGGLS